MLLQLIRSGASFKSIIVMLLLLIPVILFSLTIHEFCHAQVAYWLGDPTSFYRGRKTLNPLAHLDPIGTIALLILGIGWAKPVPVDTRYFKYPKTYMALTALAGPVSNLLVAFFSFPIMLLLTKIETSGFGTTIVSIFIDFFYLMFILNISYAVFNLLIVPPLDGSRLILTFLPIRAYYWVLKNERIISIVLFALLIFGVFDVPMSYARNFLSGAFESLWLLIIKITDADLLRYATAITMIG